MIKIRFAKEISDELLPLEIKCLHDSNMIGVQNIDTSVSFSLEKNGGVFQLVVHSNEPLFVFSSGLILPAIPDSMYACYGSEQLKSILSKKSSDKIFESLNSYAGFELAFLVIFMSYGDEIVIASSGCDLEIV